MSETQLVNGHLGTFERSRIACGDWQPDAAASAHLQTCLICREKIARETEDVQSLQGVDVPLNIIHGLNAQPQAARAVAKRQRPAWIPLAWALAGASFAAALSVAIVPRQDAVESGVRFKGDAALAISVMRDGKIVVDDEAIEKHAPLFAGDQVRLHALNEDAPWVAVQIKEDAAWADYYQGPVPKDGWYPFAIELTAPPVVQGRIVTCPKASASIEQSLRLGTCAAREFTLGQ